MNNFNYWGGANYGYNRPKMPNPTNPLSKEEMAMLKQKAPQFSLAVSQIDSLKAICTHRDAEGEKLIPNNDGTVTCSICGTTFKPIQAPPEAIEEIFNTAVDCLETIKIMYMDIPDDVTKTYFQMTPFLSKGAQLFKIALDHYNKYNNPSVIAGNYNNYGNASALYAAMMNPAMMMGMGGPAQMMNQQPAYQQPMYQPVQPTYQQPTYQQPTADVTMGVATGASVNPFDVNSPAMTNAQQVTDNKQFSL